jgi:hypothetical protein
LPLQHHQQQHRQFVTLHAAFTKRLTQLLSLTAYCNACVLSFLQTIIGLKVREVYERITEKEVIPVS